MYQLHTRIRADNLFFLSSQSWQVSECLSILSMTRMEKDAPCILKMVKFPDGAGEEEQIIATGLLTGDCSQAKHSH